MFNELKSICTTDIQLQIVEAYEVDLKNADTQQERAQVLKNVNDYRKSLI